MNIRDIRDIKLELRYRRELMKLAKKHNATNLEYLRGRIETLEWVLGRRK